jgi:aspartyl-tRNA(Asn)/glutamyl-tRNA(Gln) amidotransferase subunit A
MTRSVEDAALMLNALAGHDAHDPGSELEDAPDFTAGLKDGIKGLKVGVPHDDFFANVEPAVADCVEAAVEMLRRLGAQVREVSLPVVEPAGVISGAIIAAEAATYHLPLLRSHWDAYGLDVRARLLPGFSIAAETYLNAQRARRLVVNRMRQALDEVEVLVYPTEPTVAPALEDRIVTIGGQTEPVTGALTRLNRPGNISGFPAISLPCGFVQGLPVALQIMGRPWDEAMVLRAAYAYENATEWHKRRPPLT